jgi:hypothetical protein
VKVLRRASSGHTARHALMRRSVSSAAAGRRMSFKTPGLPC